MRPLNGSLYANIFSHYRPVGDPLWYTRPNPPGTPIAITSAGQCSIDESTLLPTCDNRVIPTLSPSLEVLKSDTDLFSWWKKVSRTPSSDQDRAASHSAGDEF